MQQAKRQTDMKIIAILIPSALLLTGCAEEPKFEKARSAMTQREKDSVIAASRLPGSGVVKKGMQIADGQAQRAAMLDSITAGN
jgi:PBP1b-binding outer membrane lipoprotein LpoB